MASDTVFNPSVASIGSRIEQQNHGCDGRMFLRNPLAIGSCENQSAVMQRFVSDALSEAQSKRPQGIYSRGDTCHTDTDWTSLFTPRVLRTCRRDHANVNDSLVFRTEELARHTNGTNIYKITMPSIINARNEHNNFICVLRRHLGQAAVQGRPCSANAQPTKLPPPQQLPSDPPYPPCYQHRASGAVVRAHPVPEWLVRSRMVSFIADATVTYLQDRHHSHSKAARGMFLAISSMSRRHRGDRGRHVLGYVTPSKIKTAWASTAENHLECRSSAA